jgi:pimeloyl-ACP methyl ester carboxylesterase
MGKEKGNSTMNTRFKRVITALAGVYFLICGALFSFQRSLLFQPTHRENRGKLTPWIVDGEQIGFCHEVPNPKGVWLMMHGNAGQASDRDYVLPHLPKSDAFYVLEYPGYGNRDGKPGRRTINAAANQAFHALRAQYPKLPLGVIGESIGTGPACQLATLSAPSKNTTVNIQGPDKIILFVPFDSLQRVVAKHFPWLPASWLLLDRWDNEKALKNYIGPLEIYGALYDQIIPFEHAKQLAKGKSQAKMISLPCGHNEWAMRPEVQIAHGQP